MWEMANGLLKLTTKFPGTALRQTAGLWTTRRPGSASGEDEEGGKSYFRTGA